MQSLGPYQNQAWLKGRRASLRKKQTKAERYLWSRIRNKQLGVRFRRQHNIDHYILDFYCHQYRLIIELDGGYHQAPKQQAYDRRRDRYFRSRGYVVLRYRNDVVFGDIDAVLRDIHNTIDAFDELSGRSA